MKYSFVFDEIIRIKCSLPTSDIQNRYDAFEILDHIIWRTQSTIVSVGIKKGEHLKKRNA